MAFDAFIAIDYSGSKDTSSQRKHIVSARVDVSVDEPVTTTGRTRIEVTHDVFQALWRATQDGRRLCIGVDFALAFPQDFVEFFCPSTPSSTNRALELICGQTSRATLPPIGEPHTATVRAAFETHSELPASLVDKLCATLKQLELGVTPAVFAHEITRYLIGVRNEVGPFWGPSFSFSRTRPTVQQPFSPLRLTDLSARRHGYPASSVFQLGGHGSVGLQSLFGMRHVALLREWCELADIPLHLWPFDGIVPREGTHVLMEVYPAMWNHGVKTDVRDAQETAMGLARQFRERRKYFGHEEDQMQWKDYIPPDSESLQRVACEGWIYGLPHISILGETSGTLNVSHKRGTDRGTHK